MNKQKKYEILVIAISITAILAAIILMAGFAVILWRFIFTGQL